MYCCLQSEGFWRYRWSQSVAAGKKTLFVVLCLEKQICFLGVMRDLFSWGNAHGSCIADFRSSLPTVTWKKTAGVLQKQVRHDVFLSQLLPQPRGGCSSTACLVFISLGSLWFTEILKAAFEVWNYLYDGPFCLSICPVCRASLKCSCWKLGHNISATGQWTCCRCLLMANPTFGVLVLPPKT